MVKYKYMRRIDCSDSEMNFLGQDGWECYSVIPVIPKCVELGFKTFFFKQKQII